MSSSTTYLEHAERRKELGAFLRASRSRLAPVPGAVVPRRRRVKGLRREEVAERAGIGVAWYTWLEQGRPITVSPETLSRIADALELKDQEKRYLLSLTKTSTRESEAAESLLPGTLARVIESLDPSPALVLNECWDVLGSNAAAEDLFGPFTGPDAYQGNIIWRLFHDPGWRILHQDWEHYARCSVAHLRGDVMAKPTLRSRSLIDELVLTSTQCRDWWESHEVLTPEPRRKTFYRVTKGEVHFDLTILQVERAPNLRVFVYSAAD